MANPPASWLIIPERARWAAGSEPFRLIVREDSAVDYFEGEE